MMKTIKNKKQQITLVALSLLFLFPSCSDFLSREPLGTLTKDDFEEGGSFEGQVMGLYADLRSEGTSGLQFVAIHSIRSDDADKGSTVSDGIDAEAMFDNFSYVATHWLLTAYWTHHYQLIHHANSIISDIEELGDLSDYNTKVNMGEAKFMRAYAYFNLVRTFGEIPKIDFKVQVASEANIPKSSVDDIYALIDADLAFAVGALPTRWPEEFKGRLTSGAAYVLQARTFVTRQNWQGAYTAAKAVITSGVYDLNTSYDMIFREVGELNSGSIFEIQAMYTKTDDYGITYATRQGVRGSGDWNMGWGWNTPSDDLANSAFEKNDPRKDATLLYAGQKNEPYGETVPAPTAELPRKYWNKKVYTDPAIRLETDSKFGQWVNVRLIRFADALLLAAEAANEIGGEEMTKEALGWLNQVRNRASGGDARKLPQRNTKDQTELRSFIRHERRVEFAMEHERFYDLVRWGVQDEKNGVPADQVYDVKTLHAVGKMAYERKHRLLPIPQEEIDKSNGILKQNPDY